MSERPEKRLYTVKEAAKYLGRGEAAVRRLVYAREIPAIQRGKTAPMYIDILDVDNWIELNKKTL